MSVFVSSGDVLEEIVEATEEQEAEFCSSGETVDETVLSNVTGTEIVDQPEQQQSHQQSTNSHRQTTKGRSSSVGSCAISSNGINGRVASRNHMEQEKRMRREIANSNERRRMQSINAGFQSLRTLLPHHEGEKLSKAAILQQTAEYIYQLEQQKTQLLSQNLQLKRLVDQQEGGDAAPIKKRKSENQGVVVSVPVHVSESGDEGLGSMSPEPLSVITVSSDSHVATGVDVADLKRQLERERLARIHLEKEMRSLRNQLIPERFREGQLIAYQPHEVIEHTNNIAIPQELDDSMTGLQVVSVVSVPTVGSTQTVETSNSETNTPPLSPQELIIPEDENIKEEIITSRASSPRLVSFQVFSSIDEHGSAGSFSPNSLTYATANVVNGNVSSASSNGSTSSSTATASTSTVTGATLIATAQEFITGSPTREFSPDRDSQPRLPSVLEAAMKAEPKVEVERLPSPSNALDDGTSARLYLAANTSRQNLETIVEAIRHLEGDHLFSDEPAQDVPLALTTSAKPTALNNTNSSKHRIIQAEVNNFLQFHATHQQAQQRPGVIVVKHS